MLMESVVDSDQRMTGMVRTSKINAAFEGRKDEPVDVYIGDADIQRVDWMGGIIGIEILFIG